MNPTIETKQWYAWFNRMPPLPHDFHVVGDVLVGNPGVEAILCPREPQGINPKVLMLDLYFCRKSGVWPEVLTWVQAHYDRVVVPEEVIYPEGYTDVEIFHEGVSLARIKVEIID